MVSDAQSKILRLYLSEVWTGPSQCNHKGNLNLECMESVERVGIVPHLSLSWIETCPKNQTQLLADLRFHPNNQTIHSRVESLKIKIRSWNRWMNHTFYLSQWLTIYWHHSLQSVQVPHQRHEDFQGNADSIKFHRQEIARINYL